LVVVPADAGFFSVFNTLISIRAHWLGAHGFSSIEPDWSIARVLDFWKTENLTSYCYAGEHEGNVFLTLFENYESFLKPLEDNSLGGTQVRSVPMLSHSPNLFPDPDFTYVYADRLYRSAGFQIWRNEMNKALGGLKPNKKIVSQIDEVFSNLSPNTLLIGMHVRHPSHAMEQPNSEIPLSEDFIKVARDIIAENLTQFGEIKVFLATDQDVVVDAFKSEFKDKLLCFVNKNLRSNFSSCFLNPS
jgi:hypothetical protein